MTYLVKSSTIDDERALTEVWNSTVADLTLLALGRSPSFQQKKTMMF